MPYFSETFTAGEKKLIACPGRYARMLWVTNGSVDATFKKNGTIIETLAGFDEGMQIRANFDSIELTYSRAGAIGLLISNEATDHSSPNSKTQRGGVVHTPCTVTNASQQFRADWWSRRFCSIQNRDAAGIVYAYFNTTGPATPTNGLKIGPGQTLTFDGSFCPNQAIHLIGDIASNANVLIVDAGG